VFGTEQNRIEVMSEQEGNGIRGDHHGGGGNVGGNDFAMVNR
jgi:hypothetical protein